MKSLHKKLSAMLLAGVVVLGGVVGSGVSSFAASKGANLGIEREVQRVKSVVKKAGAEVVLVNKNGKEVDNIVKQDYKDCYRKEYLKNGGSVKSAYQVPINFNKFRHDGKKLVKVKCQDFYYLIKLS